MSRWSRSLQRYTVCVGFVCGLCWQVSYANTSIADTGETLDLTETLQITDHPQSLQQLASLNQETALLTPDQQWHLRYLNAWEAMYESDYAKSETLFQDIIRHSSNPIWADRASALLLSQFGITRHYTDAFELANHLTARLPQVTDAKGRFAILLNLSQSLGLAGQTDLAVHYARMAMAVAPAGKGSCYSASSLVQALSNGHRLKLDSPELQQAIDACTAAKVPVYSTDLQLTLVALYLNEGQPRKALALLDQIAPAINVDGYVPNKLEALVNRAQALAVIGNDGSARKVALSVVAMDPSSDWLKDAYEVLYRIEKKQGNTAAALDYHEKFAALDKAYLDDIHARALAYEAVQQHVLAQKLDTEKLSEQNAGLRAQQKLDAKTAEANRLYLVLLLMALGFGALAMFRLKRSQLRFKRLSHLDGLTAIYNRQHFMGEAGRLLYQLEKRRGAACVAIIDLDHFKSINDTHGHAMGDEVLRRVVAACKQHLRTVDLFGRLGGEEFGILLVDCSREQSIAIAERIRAAIEATSVELDSVVVKISTSIGLAFTDAAGYDLRSLCTGADAALYGAKRGGRNCVMAGVEDLAMA
ncbi:tetratricopeptide repeat-containing diguanylate cyclase [Rhodanobacter hydrolyticus]|uniref:diguanylate cyclase n=1 Tax=Rhodanobacter hydrolyticus TaxID=2250595 RepID=A0ABW8J4D9_9GAMM